MYKDNLLREISFLATPFPSWSLNVVEHFDDIYKKWPTKVRAASLENICRASLILTSEMRPNEMRTTWIVDKNGYTFDIDMTLIFPGQRWEGVLPNSNKFHGTCKR